MLIASYGNTGTGRTTQLLALAFWHPRIQPEAWIQQFMDWQESMCGMCARLSAQSKVWIVCHYPHLGLFAIDIWTISSRASRQAQADIAQSELPHLQCRCKTGSCSDFIVLYSALAVPLPHIVKVSVGLQFRIDGPLCLDMLHGLQEGLCKGRQ